MAIYESWAKFLACHSNAHLLQTGNWGKLKTSFGWSVEHIIEGKIGIQILFKRLPFGMRFAYAPKGPVGEDWQHILPQLDTLCRQQHAIFLKVEPDKWVNPATNEPPPQGFRLSTHSIQPKSTLVVNIGDDETTILEHMKQKTRYNIKVAKKRGVLVRASSDLVTFYRLMQETGGRDQFGIHSLAYYQRAYQLFKSSNSCELLLAEFDGKPLAGLMVFYQGKRAWYLFGASSNELREYMPTYLLQWEAIRWARERGCTQYDLWGVPDAEESNLEAEFIHRSDGLWGVYRNKRGYGGILYRSAGPWDRVYSPFAYQLYTWWVSHRSTPAG